MIKGWQELNKSQRMQIKALICVLGLLLIIILGIGSIIFSWIQYHRAEEEVIPEHIPIVEILKNVWLLEAGNEKVIVFEDGNKEEYFYGALSTAQNPDHRNVETIQYHPGAMLTEQLADITLTDGRVTDIKPKQLKLSARVLSATSEYIELEGYGQVPLAKDYKGYRIFNQLLMCTREALTIGYSFADFVVENGEICGILIAREEAMENIRVLIKGDSFQGLSHEAIQFTCDSDYRIQYGSYENPMVVECLAGQIITIDENSDYFTGDRIWVQGKANTGKLRLLNLERNQDKPEYRGMLELIHSPEGIVVINELPLEEYLYSVVPSEMPASYPKEALKAQAVCARTYAYGKMLQAGYPQYGAHLDDSTTFQVYNNILEQESCTSAVRDTYGQLIFTTAEELAETYYYSTSCGIGSDASVWKTNASKELTYLTPNPINKAEMEASVFARKNGESIINEQGEAGYQEGNSNQQVSSYQEVGVFQDEDQYQDEAFFESFISGKQGEDFESTNSWYRWSYQVKKLMVKELVAGLQQRYSANEKLILTKEEDAFVSKEIPTFSKVLALEIIKRGAGGIAEELLLETDKGSFKVVSEYNIRYVLRNGDNFVLRQDGSEYQVGSILPSAFIVLKTSMEKDNVVGYSIKGGGFGHGVGMSQNAAKEMAGVGYNYQDILYFFYRNCSIRNVYSGE